MDVDAYLARIGHEGPVRADAATLAALQAAHLTSVAFENLDVVAGAAQRTTPDWSVPKVVQRRRGGWCFELNSAFGSLLAAIGFPVTACSARVWDADAAELGPALDHLCLLVEADGERWLADVGFGDSVLAPLLTGTAEVQDLAPRPARLEQHDGELHHLQLGADGEWALQYVVDPTPRKLPEFQVRSDALAAGAGNGYFRDKPFATRALDATSGDRVWLLGDRLKFRRGGVVGDPVAVEAAAWDDVLFEWFGMRRP